MNPYLDDSTEKRVLLEFDGLILTNDDIQEGMSLSEQVNTGTDLQLGTCCAAELGFTVLDLSQELTKADFVGREFRLRRGVQTGENDVWGGMRRRGLFLAVRSGPYWCGVSRNGKNLMVWNGDERLADPAQPVQPVRCLLLRDGLLCCGHEGGAVTAYTIGADGALTQLEIALSAFERQQVERYVKRGDAIHLSGDVMLLYRKDWAEGQVIRCAEQVIEFADAGYFTPAEAGRKNDNLLTVKAYDRMTRFDAPVDEYLDGLKYPVSMRSYLQGLCSFCGVGLAAGDFPNQDFLIGQNIRTLNLPGRDVLGWIAQAAARFARINPAGDLELAKYTGRDYTISASEYTSLSVSEYVTLPIDKAQIRATGDDIGVIVGEGENAYVIQGNPLLYADTDAELRPAAEAVYAEVAGLSYVPFSVACRGNPLIRAGDIITVQSRKGQTVRALIMSRTLRGVRALSDEYEATGNRTREAMPRENQAVTQLRGRINEVSVTLEETRSTLTQYQTDTDGTISKMRSEFRQTAEGITLTVSQNKQDADGAIASLQTQQNQTAEGVTRLELTTQGIASEVENQAGDISKLQQTAQGLSITVSGVVNDVDGLETSLGNTNTQVSQLGTSLGNTNSQVSQLETSLSNTQKSVTTLELTTSGLKLAVDNKKLTFNKDGLSIYNGGFRIYNGSNSIFSVAADGSGLVMDGTITTSGVGAASGVAVKTILGNGELQFYEGSGGSFTLTGRMSAYKGSITLFGPVSIAEGTLIRTENLDCTTLAGYGDSGIDLEYYLINPVKTAYIKDLVVQRIWFGLPNERAGKGWMGTMSSCRTQQVLASAILNGNYIMTTTATVYGS